MSEEKGLMTYTKVGGSYQLCIRNLNDLKALLQLDEAFWALNCIDINSLRMDRRFLSFVDADNDGKIRTDEIRNAVLFLLEHLKNGSGFENESDILTLESINEAAPAGTAMLESAKIILKNLGKPEKSVLTLTELRNDKGIRSRSYNNGDGVVTPDPDQSEEMNERIALLMRTAGSTDDISGAKGVNAAILDKFIAESAAFVAWDDQLQADDGTLRCFGENTQAVYEKFLAIKEDIDNYFLNSETLEFFSVEPERVAKKDLAADVRAPQDIKSMLEKSVLALPRADRTLDLNDKLNPLLRGKVESFFSIPEGAAMLSDNRLSIDEWQNFKSKIAPYDAWSKAKPAFAALYAAENKELLKSAAADDVMAQLRTALANDLNAGTALAGIDVLHKLMLFQRFLKPLLNTFVSMSSLFNLETSSPLQAGKLVMDGRHFTLAVPVNDLAEHKKIVAMSNICVLYVELSPSSTIKPPFKTVAVAVSSGNMRNLFVGKRGLFFGADGGVFDAKVIAFIEQPVSISEAMKNPFFRFGSFIGDQITKFLNTKSAGAQKDLGGQIASGKVPPVAPAPQSGNASMLLMSGGIGIAALGSSVAFITKQLQNVSIWNILSVLLGIVLIFGGPVVAISLFKLFRRDLSRFLEATGCAVNRRMRMSRKMGEIFTFQPTLPKGKKLRSNFVSRKIEGAWKSRLLTVFVIVIIAAVCCGIWYMRGQERIQNAKLAAECKKTTVPAPQSQTKDKKATAVKDAKKISVQVQPVKNAPAKAAADKK